MNMGSPRHAIRFDASSLALLLVVTCAPIAAAQSVAAGLAAGQLSSDPETVESVVETQDRSTAELRQRYAMIVIGIPGDQKRRQLFMETANVWRRWLVEIAGVAEADLTVLVGEDETENTQPATAKRIAKVVEQLSSKATGNDSVWVFLLGHGSQDKRHAWFHLAGPDFSEAEWAGLFAQLKAKEQVFWLTHAASGRFLKAMSLPGRIVISATDADGEVNETRFPHFLAETMQQQLIDKQAESADKSTPINVLELMRATSEQVDQFFEDEKLVPTEHAQLDDNGDGVGTEISDLASTATAGALIDPSQSVVDGLRADHAAIEFASVPDISMPNPETRPLSPTGLTP